jgi:hypothetical protein
MSRLQVRKGHAISVPDTRISRAGRKDLLDPVYCQHSRVSVFLYCITADLRLDPEEQELECMKLSYIPTVSKQLVSTESVRSACV